MENYEKQHRLRQREQREQLKPEEQLKQLQAKSATLEQQLRNQARAVNDGIKSNNPAVLQEIAMMSGGKPENVNKIIDVALRYVDKADQPKPEQVAAAKTKIQQMITKFEQKMKQHQDRLQKNMKRIANFLNTKKQLKQNPNPSEEEQKNIQSQANQLADGLRNKDEDTMEGIWFYASENSDNSKSKYEELIRSTCTAINETASTQHKLTETDLEQRINKMCE